MSDPSYPAYPVLSFLGAALVLVPLSWHLQAWNAGTCLYMFWTSLACLNLGINSIIWHGNAINVAPVWCDISSRIIVASAVAIPTASLCIVRRLYHIANSQTVSVSFEEKRRAIIIDLLIGLGVPILQVIMQYVVSGHRFDIYEDIGCYPFTYNTPLSYPLSQAWPIAIGLISAVYCILTIRAFLRRRAQLSMLFASSSSLTVHRYMRLVALALTEILCTVPLASYGLYLNLSAGTDPWISWSDTHFHYSQVDQYPALLWRMDRTAVISLELSRWLPVFCAFVFFGFFGFAQEARRHYRQVYALMTGLFAIKAKVRPRFKLPSPSWAYRTDPSASQSSMAQRLFVASNGPWSSFTEDSVDSVASPSSATSFLPHSPMKCPSQLV